MESVVRIFIVALLTVSSASAVQFSLQKVERFTTMARTYECRVGQAAEAASRVIAHHTARPARAGWEPGALASRMKPQSGRCEIAETMKDLWKAYGH
jgi:hypothetical protein